jgi:hypothetical protein
VSPTSLAISCHGTRQVMGSWIVLLSYSWSPNPTSLSPENLSSAVAAIGQILEAEDANAKSAAMDELTGMLRGRAKEDTVSLPQQIGGNHCKLYI